MHADEDENPLGHDLIREVKDYAIFRLDAGAHVVSWNEVAELITGYRRGEVTGKHFAVFFTPEDRTAGKPEHELEMARRDGRFEDESWRVRRDGTRFWANEVITALHGEGGRLLGFLKIVRDLSRRKALEDALRESEQRHRLLVENARDYAIFMADPAGNVVTWNTGAERIFRYTDDEIIGVHASVLFTPEDKAAGEHEKELATALRRGSASDDRWQMRKGGERFWASGVTTAMYDGERALRGFAKVCRDLTERKHAEEQLRSLNESLEQRVAQRTGELVAYQQQLRTLVAELSRAEQRERQRVAGELHDNLAQMMAVCRMKVSAVAADAPPRSRLAADAAAAKDLLGEAIEYTRSLMTELSPVILNRDDLDAAVEWAVQRAEKLGLRVRLVSDGRPAPLDDEVRGLLSRRCASCC